MQPNGVWQGGLVATQILPARGYMHAFERPASLARASMSREPSRPSQEGQGGKVGVKEREGEREKTRQKEAKIKGVADARTHRSRSLFLEQEKTRRCRLGWYEDSSQDKYGDKVRT